MKLTISSVLCVVVVLAIASVAPSEQQTFDTMGEKEQVATMIHELTQSSGSPPRHGWRGHISGKADSGRDGPLMSIESIREIQKAMHELRQCENDGRALNTTVEETPFFAGDVILNPLRVKGWVEECKNRRWKPNGRHHRSKRQFTPQYRSYSFMWPKVNNVYPIHLQVTHGFRNSRHYQPFLQMLKEFEHRSCIRPTLSWPPNYRAATIKVVSNPNMRGCGRATDGWQKQNQNFLQIMEKSGCKSGVLYHEFMHNLGFLHEHMRYDRDQYVDVNKTLSTINRNYKICHDCPIKLAYDYSSIMHYYHESGILSAAWGKQRFNNNMGNRNAMTFLDWKEINEFYCKDSCPRKRDCGVGYQNPNKCYDCVCPDGNGPTCDNPSEAQSNMYMVYLTDESSAWRIQDFPPRTSKLEPSETRIVIDTTWSPNAQLIVRPSTTWIISSNCHEESVEFHFHSDDLSKPAPAYCGNVSASMPLIRATSSRMLIVWRYTNPETTGRIRFDWKIVTPPTVGISVDTFTWGRR